MLLDSSCSSIWRVKPSLVREMGMRICPVQNLGVEQDMARCAGDILELDSLPWPGHVSVEGAGRDTVPCERVGDVIMVLEALAVL